MVLDRINVSRRKTIIFECDFFALPCALVTWKEILTGFNFVLHTDNDSVRDCFISYHTTSENAVRLLDACLAVETQMGCNAWITRVPTESNVSEDPSRLQVEKLIQCGCVCDVQCGTDLGFVC